MSRRPRQHADRCGPPAPAFTFLDNAGHERVSWLWPGRIPLGALSLLIGDPGVGKSLVTVDLAARLSVPRPWPDDPRAERSAPPAPQPADTDRPFDVTLPPPIRGLTARRIPPTGVIFAAPEDRPALPGRLAAAGAEPARVSILDGIRLPFAGDLLPLRLPSHADQLEQAIRAHDHPRLVVLDPLHLLLDDGVYTSPDRQADLFDALGTVARHTGVAVLAVGHFSKAPARRTLYRIRGSLSLSAAARSILLVTTDPDQSARRILTQLKNTYGPPATPLAFRIVDGAAGPHTPRSAALPQTAAEPAQPDAPPEARSPNGPRLVWEDPTDADWRLATGTLDLSPESSSALSEACDWLADYLAEAPRPARDVLHAARAAGIPRATLFRAKRLLNVTSRRRAHDWIWVRK